MLISVHVGHCKLVNYEPVLLTMFQELTPVIMSLSFQFPAYGDSLFTASSNEPMQLLYKSLRHLPPHWSPVSYSALICIRLSLDRCASAWSMHKSPHSLVTICHCPEVKDRQKSSYMSCRLSLLIYWDMTRLLTSFVNRQKWSCQDLFFFTLLSDGTL